MYSETMDTMYNNFVIIFSGNVKEKVKTKKWNWAGGSGESGHTVVQFSSKKDLNSWYNFLRCRQQERGNVKGKCI